MAVRRETAERYVWGAACDGWRLADGDDLSVIEERMPPGASEARHRHVRARQVFYVLRGELTMEVDGRLERLRAGDALEVAPGTPHTAVNRSDADVEFLVVSAPTTRGDRAPA